MNKAVATNNAKIKIYGIEWYVPPYTLSMERHKIISKQILSKSATELQYVKKSFFMTEVNTQKIWSFELRTQEGMIVLFGLL